eukprot:CAMPEP_0184697054 /NCGR_PEP_ID=MMETSP0313-20130426/4159_1 /TAXON_ID=2792 /ORGANISM="Porphyridium aerugineum, Strain SAG 1380-2" /LENGTH=510 /DNA_ID=CAMNT_0027155815 /DNA_START=338 /DNA_END=1870 /DNA_ORIENTATION=+
MVPLHSSALPNLTTTNPSITSSSSPSSQERPEVMQLTSRKNFVKYSGILPNNGLAPTSPRRKTKRGGKRVQRGRRAIADRQETEKEKAAPASPATFSQKLARSVSATTRRPDGTPLQYSESAYNEPGQLVKLLGFLRDLGISIEDCGRLVQRRPQLLRLSIPNTTDQYIHFLSQEPLSMNADQIRRCVRNAPQIFSKKISNIQMRLDFLTNELHVPAKELGAMISKRPHIMWMDLGMAQNSVKFLKETVGLSDEAVTSTIVACPIVLLEPALNLCLKLDWLETQIGALSREQVATIVTNFPEIFLYRTDTALAKRMTYLKDELQLPVRVLTNLIVSCPSVLEKSVIYDLEKSVATLKEWGLVSSSEDLVHILDKAPKLFDTRFEERLLYLRDVVGLNPDALRKVVHAFPATLLLSVGRSLSVKFKFLTEVLHGSAQDLVAIPNFFELSLEKTLFPRHAFLCSKGISDFDIQVLALGSNDEFCSKLANVELQEFEKFDNDGNWILFYTPVM